MIRFHCFECRRSFEAENFNLARIIITCPVCATHLNIAQSIGRAYGKIVGERVTKIMEALERLCAKSKENLATPITLAYIQIKALCEEADKEKVTA